MLRTLAIASLVLTACPGSSPKGGVVEGPPTSEPGKLPSGPPLVTPGERMTYRLSLGGVELAAYTLAVGEIADLGGKNAITVQGQAKSVGLANMVAKVDDLFISWIDVETGRPLRFQTQEFASKSTDVEHTLVDFMARENDTVPVTFRLNDTETSPEAQKVDTPEVWDYNAFLVALRAWEAPAGAKVALKVMRSRYLWHVDMKVHGKTKLVTELGELPALRLDGHTYKLDRDLSKFPDPARNFTLWISDDDGRVPLRIDTETDYGQVKMEIVDYNPGSGNRLRP